MDDFISREAAIALTDQHCFETSYDAVWMEEALRNLQAADVRPVVLCKDCVYYNTTGCADGFGWCEGVMVSKGTSDDFFCAEGKQNPYECGAEMEPNLDATKGERRDNSSG